MNQQDLDELLDRHCRTLGRAVKTLPPGKDLPPALFGFKGEAVIPFQFLHRIEKPIALAIFSVTLQQLEADAYCITSPGWYVKVEPDEQAAVIEIAQREGLRGELKERRCECYMIVVGDRERTLTALFDVGRNAKGKITRFERVTKQYPQAIFGGMIDLLVEKTVH